MTSLPRFLVKIIRPALRSITTDGEENVYVSRNEIVNRSANVDRTPRSAENRSPMLMNVINKRWRNLYRLHSALRIEPRVSAAEAQHFSHAVAIMQLEKQRANDVVETGTQTAARHNAGACLFRVEEKFRARAG
jgi:hypothetical protein